MNAPEPPAGSEHYREGWRHGYEQAAIDRERSADAVRLVPEVGQARDDVRGWLHERIEAGGDPMLARVLAALNEPSRDTTQAREPVMTETTRKLARRVTQYRRETLGWLKQAIRADGEAGEANNALIRERQIAVLTTGDGHVDCAIEPAQVPESPTASSPKAGRWGSGEVETATGAGQARETGADWAARPRRYSPEDTLSVAERLGAAEPAGGTVQAPAGPPVGFWDESGSTSPVIDWSPVQAHAPNAADLAYARSEVDKWLADGDPYCILPTRTEHIPALLARLDELEGTR